MLFDEGSLTHLPFGLPGPIYRSPMPFRYGDQEGKLFEQYRQAGIQVVVVLAEADECFRKTGRDLLRYYVEQGIYVIHCPIPDFGVPESHQALEQAIISARMQAEQGKAVAVHCYAGFGRTGLFMGCMARQVFGLTGEQAVRWVRQYVPVALENEDQVRYVNDCS